MVYVLLFLEGVLTFISPCLLPMLPIYITYFAGGSDKPTALKNALGFVLGFTLVFISLGAFSGSIGRALLRYAAAVNVATGLVVVLFGLHYLGALRIPLLDRTVRLKAKHSGPGFPSSVLFGLTFSIGWTPCVGAFLGSALMMASQQGSMIRGMSMLLAFSLGLGLPFVASAVLIEWLKGAFQWVKDHYRMVNAVSGGLLVLVGILMMTGVFGRFLSLFA